MSNDATHNAFQFSSPNDSARHASSYYTWTTSIIPHQICGHACTQSPTPWKNVKNLIKIRGFWTMDNSRFSMLLIVHFKIIDISLEVSQKSTFRKRWKTANSQWSLPMINMASIWPLKKSHWSLLILIISPQRPPYGFIWIVDVSMCVKQK